MGDDSWIHSKIQRFCGRMYTPLKLHLSEHFFYNCIIVALTFWFFNTNPSHLFNCFCWFHQLFTQFYFHTRIPEACIKWELWEFVDIFYTFILFSCLKNVIPHSKIHTHTKLQVDKCNHFVFDLHFYEYYQLVFCLHVASLSRY